jgi:hypothetical protein
MPMAEQDLAATATLSVFVIKVGLRGGPPGAPNCRGHQNITGIKLKYGAS